YEAGQRQAPNLSRIKMLDDKAQLLSEIPDVLKAGGVEDIFSAISNFCGGTPLSDDCTVVEMVYTG
ncbi:MAG: hypothetical protein LAO09_10010, partial [Acidobacteriia bacterium]|nr:hypothetical protein [Terriglobia bacterium]